MYNQKSVCNRKVALIPGELASSKIYFSYYILPSSLLVYGTFEPVFLVVRNLHGTVLVPSSAFLRDELESRQGFM